ncbi:sugar phosphate isomerase/epimerase [Arachidicoccus soli]|uniref:Sugar phosphate isomerase/epimerase n=2 Tax=Arachidicoccus soli TaxID=2341117 RepID=A0A386HUZ5_9BACT|nr:sugar phosphate isomerase/epimerase [Arachidicoccus soli]
MGVFFLKKNTSFKGLFTLEKKNKYKIAVADIMILKRQKIGEFALSKALGAEGVEVDMGGLGNRESFDNKLADPTIRKQFLEEAGKQNVQICSLAMTGFYSQSFAKRATYKRNIQDCLDTAKAMDVKVVFLPLGVNSDIQKQPALRAVVVERLKVVGEMAKAANIVIGVETTLDATEELKFLKEINSPGIKSYFNFANALDAGRDLYNELMILGKDNICQIHCTDTDGYWLQNDPKMDMKKVKKTLDEMNWGGWLVIERSRDAKDPRNVKYNFTANTSYMKKIFK